MADPFGPSPKIGALAMPITRLNPPLDYLQAASRSSLQSFELTRLNHAANLRQEIAALIDQWVQETSEAMLARWMLDHHKAPQPSTMSAADPSRTLSEAPTTLFAESHPPVSPLTPPQPRFVPSRTQLKDQVTRRSQQPRQAATG